MWFTARAAPDSNSRGLGTSFIPVPTVYVIHRSCSSRLRPPRPTDVIHTHPYNLRDTQLMQLPTPVFVNYGSHLYSPLRPTWFTARAVPKSGSRSPQTSFILTQMTYVVINSCNSRLRPSRPTNIIHIRPYSLHGSQLVQLLTLAPVAYERHSYSSLRRMWFTASLTAYYSFFGISTLLEQLSTTLTTEYYLHNNQQLSLHYVVTKNNIQIIVIQLCKSIFANSEKNELVCSSFIVDYFN